MHLPINSIRQIQLRSSASLNTQKSSYGSVNSSEIDFFPQNSQSSTATHSLFDTDSKKTQFIEIPNDVLNHIANFLGYNETLKSLLPTSTKIFVAVLANEFRITVNMPMPNGTNLIQTNINYIELKKIRLDELKRQIDENFEPENIFDRTSSRYWSGFFKPSITIMLILMTSFLIINSQIDLYSLCNKCNDETASSFIAMGAAAFILATSASLGFLNLHPNHALLKKDIETIPTSQSFERTDRRRDPSAIGVKVRLRLKKENEDHQNFLRLFESIKTGLQSESNLASVSIC